MSIPRHWILLVLAITQMATTLWPTLTGIGELVQVRSDTYPTPVVPIGWTFAIWGVIYLGTSAFAIWQFLAANRNSALVNRVAPAIAWMFLVNTVWQVWVSIVGFGWIDFLMLASEAAAGTWVLIQLTRQSERLRLQEVLFLAAPIGLLTGWTTAATFVGSTVSASALELGAWATSASFGYGLLIAAIAVASLLLLVHRNLAYAAAGIWALWGVSANAQVKGLEAIQAVSLQGMGVLAILCLGVAGWLAFKRFA